MIRFCKFDDCDIDYSEVIALNKKNKCYFMNTGKRSYDKEFKERKWNEIKNITKEERAYIIPKEDIFISLAYISDVESGGANIVVETNENYRRLGYGKKVVSRAVKWCNDYSLLPIYFVNNNNEASKK